jgi:hypothetical protein
MLMGIILMNILSPLVSLIVIVTSVTESFNNFTANLLPPQSVNELKFFKQILGASISNFKSLV